MLQFNFLAFLKQKTFKLIAVIEFKCFVTT